MRAVERDNLGSHDIFPGLGALHFTVGGGGECPGENAQGSQEKSSLSMCQEVPGHLQKGQHCSRFILQHTLLQWIMKNDICTKWREKALFL